MNEEKVYKVVVNGESYFIDEKRYQALEKEGRTIAILLDGKLFFVTPQIYEEMSIGKLFDGVIGDNKYKIEENGEINIYGNTKDFGGKGE